MANGNPEPIEAENYYRDKLAKLGMSMAQGLHDRALAAETGAEAAELAKAFHQVSRGVAPEDGDLAAAPVADSS